MLKNLEVWNNLFIFAAQKSRSGEIYRSLSLRKGALFIKGEHGEEEGYCICGRL